MINSKAYDVEIFPNLFSVTIVDLRAYLNIFKDCCDKEGEPKALTECLSVKEINERLDSVPCVCYKISDTDDSQLLTLASAINDMSARFIEESGENGLMTKEPCRTDMFGFNSLAYDDMMIRAFMMQFNRFDTTAHLITYLYNFSKKLISLQDNYEAFYADKEMEVVRGYRLPWATVDVFKVYALNSAGVNVDKDTGARNKFAKGLKQTSINLKWHNLLDFVLPPIDEEEAQLYWWKKKEYKGLSIEHLNALCTNDFDRYVLPKYVDHMLYYNRNDVFLVCEIVRQKPDEIKLRYSISSAFKLNVLSSARSNISDKLLVKFYSEMSGLRKDKFEKLRTERRLLSFNKIIFPHIKFKTKELQDLLADMMKVGIYRTTKDEFSRTINFYGTTYTLATGGIHSVDPPRILKSDDKYVYVHHDYTSYYPSIMISYLIAPKHLNTNVFCKMVDYIKSTRVKAKHTKDSDGYVIAGVPNKVTAAVLKIVINAIYGKLGFDSFWLYDRLAQMKVTINGQLMTMTLIEELELNGIHVVSANTDGIVLKLPRDKRDIYNKICKDWNEFNKMGADDEEYKIVVSRDVNNYFDIQTDGTIEFKGAFNPKQYLVELKKGYDMPIVAIAVFEYFAHNVPVMETLQKHTDILDFCKTQNVGRQFDVVYDKVVNGKITTIRSQRHVRFYVSRHGVIIQKENVNDHSRSRLASGLPVKILNSLDDKDIALRDIDYKYYYEECYKIINPIRLGISPNQKADAAKGYKSGKSLLKKYNNDFLSLFDEDEDS